jgi:hypothetical protein
VQPHLDRIPLLSLLQPFLHPIPALLHALLHLGPQVASLLLLLGRQDLEHFRPDLGGQDRSVGFDRRHGGVPLADQRLVDRLGLDGLAERLTGRLTTLAQGLELGPVLLQDRPDLLALGVGQVEATQPAKDVAAQTAGTRPPRSAAHPAAEAGAWTLACVQDTGRDGSREAEDGAEAD